MSKFILNLYLLFGAYQDKKTKTIKIWYLWLGGFLGVYFKIKQIYTGNIQVWSWLLCLLPGIFFLIIAKIKKEKIGEGDAWILIILGNCFWGIHFFRLIYLSVLLIAIYSFILLIMKKVDGKTQIPFLPFLWIADTVLWGVEYVT